MPTLSSLAKLSLAGTKTRFPKVVAPTATLTSDGTYYYQAFTTVGFSNLDLIGGPLNVEFLLVGGGGAAGNSAGATAGATQYWNYSYHSSAYCDYYSSGGFGYPSCGVYFNIGAQIQYCFWTCNAWACTQICLVNYNYYADTWRTHKLSGGAGGGGQVVTGSVVLHPGSYTLKVGDGGKPPASAGGARAAAGIGGDGETTYAFFDNLNGGLTWSAAYIAAEGGNGGSGDRNPRTGIVGYPTKGSGGGAGQGGDSSRGSFTYLNSGTDVMPIGSPQNSTATSYQTVGGGVYFAFSKTQLDTILNNNWLTTFGGLTNAAALTGALASVGGEGGGAGMRASWQNVYNDGGSWANLNVQAKYFVIAQSDSLSTYYTNSSYVEQTAGVTYTTANEYAAADVAQAYSGGASAYVTTSRFATLNGYDFGKGVTVWGYNVGGGGMSGFVGRVNRYGGGYPGKASNYLTTDANGLAGTGGGAGAPISGWAGSDSYSGTGIGGSGLIVLRYKKADVGG